MKRKKKKKKMTQDVSKLEIFSIGTAGIKSRSAALGIFSVLPIGRIHRISWTWVKTLELE